MQYKLACMSDSAPVLCFCARVNSIILVILNLLGTTFEVTTSLVGLNS